MRAPAARLTRRFLESVNPDWSTLPPGMPEAARILIVDDDADSGELTRRRLARGGLDADFHQGPFGSMAAFDKGDYLVVILDVMMPGLSGTNLIQALWERAERQRPRIMLYSSLDEGALREKAQKHGADAYLTKAASKAELVERVRKLLDGAGSA